MFVETYEPKPRIPEAGASFQFLASIHYVVIVSQVISNVKNYFTVVFRIRLPNPGEMNARPRLPDPIQAEHRD